MSLRNALVNWDVAIGDSPDAAYVGFLILLTDFGLPDCGLAIRLPVSGA